ncbi:MAG: ComF family protein, partial [Pseudomonadota bacterium]|nr:ComF family protein [Pseudomonadota bacterium]
MPGPVCAACLIDPPPFDSAVAAFDYAPPWDRLITDFKFHDAIDLATTFAGALVSAVRHAENVAVDCLLPVPLAALRRRERGYNQA